MIIYQYISRINTVEMRGFFILILSANFFMSIAQNDPSSGESSIVPGLDHGLLQSPININTLYCDEGIHEVELHYNTSHEHIVHKEHLVEIDYDPGSYILFDGRKYNFKQFHFHTPSEHLVDGVHYPLEMHMVHLDTGKTPNYLVISILFKEGTADPFLNQFIEEVPEDYKEIDIENKIIDIREELWPGELQEYYFYKGSLTTPPYTETVSWLIVGHIHGASPEQISHLKDLEGINNRKIQKLNERDVEYVHH